MKVFRDRLLIHAAALILGLGGTAVDHRLAAGETGNPGISPAAPVSAASPEPNYGTATEAMLFVGAAAFNGARPDIIVNDDGNGSGVFLGTGTNAQAWAPLSLPDGALITGIDLYYYDWNASLNLNAFIYQFPASGDSYSTLAATASSGSGGWGVATHNPASPRPSTTHRAPTSSGLGPPRPRHPTSGGAASGSATSFRSHRRRAWRASATSRRATGPSSTSRR